MRIRGMTTRLLAATATISLAATLAPAPASAQSQTYNLNIPAMDLGDALRAFGRATRQQVVFSGAAVRGRRSNAIEGNFAARDALDRMLEGSGLTVRVGSGGIFMVAPGNGEAPASGEGQAGGAAADSGSADGEEIVVTGTNLRGVTPSSPVITVDREAIERSGFQNAGDLVRSIPQSFGGGYNLTIGNGGAAGSSQSQSYVSTANLRGLGSDATLTLVDGHRLSAADFTTSVDISLIPLEAIERVEVLADGASAIYGSDAVAGVVNFILRRRYDGVRVSADVGTATRGGGTRQNYSLLAGRTWGSGSLLLNYEYALSDEILAGDRSFTSPNIDETFLLPRQNRHSVFGQFHQQLADNVTFSVQGLYTHRQALENVDFTAFQYLSDATVEQYGLVGTLAADLGDDWRIEISGNSAYHSRLQIASAFGQQFPSDSRNRLHSGELKLSGALFTLPAGAAQLAAGGGYRWEGLRQGTLIEDRNTKYAFAEVAFPLLSSAMGVPGVDMLQVNAAVRWEDYSQFGQTTNPKLGIVYRPFRDLTLKASWGQSFRAPSLTQLYSTPRAFLQSVPDPASSTGRGLLLALSGGNPDLGPEEARTLTLHATYQPGFIPRARFGITYFDIKYTNRIANPISNFALGFTDPIAAVFLTRNPSSALQAAAIAGRVFQNNSGQPYDPSLVTGLLLNQNQNFVADDVNGIDLLLDYSIPTARGSVELTANGTWLDNERQVVANLPPEQLTGRVYRPPSFRARAGATWIHGGFSLSGFVNHTSAFEDVSTQPATPVSSWTTADLQIAYRAEQGRLRGFGAAVSVINLFDRDPPRLNSLLPGYTGFGFDSTNASGVGRFVSLRLSKEF